MVTALLDALDVGRRIEHSPICYLSLITTWLYAPVETGGKKYLKEFDDIKDAVGASHKMLDLVRVMLLSSGCAEVVVEKGHPRLKPLVPRETALIKLYGILCPLDYDQLELGL